MTSGRQCGVGEAADYPKIMWPSLSLTAYNYAVCTKGCRSDKESFSCLSTDAFEDKDVFEYNWDPATCTYNYIDYDMNTCNLILTADLDTFCLPDPEAAKVWIQGFYSKYGGDKLS